MRKIQWRALGLVTAVGSVAALSVLSAAPAGAAILPATSSAYGVQACLLALTSPLQCTVKVGPTPAAAYPTGPGTASVTNLDLSPVGTVRLVNVSASGNDLTGFSTATATTNNTSLLPAGVPGGAVGATVIKATCTATKGTATGGATFVGLTLAGQAVPLGPLGASTPNNVLLNLPGVAKIVLNEQTKSAGAITVNAVHVFLGPIKAGAGSLGDVILSHVSCGPNAGTPATATGIDPDHGPTAGGTKVTITGTCFVAGKTSVTIGGITIPASKVTVAKDGKSLTFITPPHAAGPVRVTVSTVCGPAGPLTYTYIPPPSAPPTSSAPANSIPTGVPAGGPVPTHGGSPVLPLTGLLGLMLVAGGVVAYRKRGTLDHQ